ncbi:MAG: GntR family transcriptional regulator [bacterium]
MALSDTWGTPPEREPAGAVAYRLMRSAILGGRIPQGARINELALADAWKMSRTPIRDALRRLEGEGLVEAVPRRGMRVRRLQPADVEDLYEVGEALEGVAARRAAERGTGAFLADLNGLIKSYGTALKQGDFDRILAVDEELHRTIARRAQNLHLERAIETVRAQLRGVHHQLIQSRGRATKSFRELAKMIAAIRRRDPAHAEAAMREHLVSLRADAGLLPPEERDE